LLLRCWGSASTSCSSACQDCWSPGRSTKYR
ncbi:MAG: hypothetical protein AVDCRST_MAG26-1211, partial [uncultured Chloroflexia bacterium]